jgi:hypothetical protein
MDYNSDLRTIVSFFNCLLSLQINKAGLTSAANHQLYKRPEHKKTFKFNRFAKGYQFQVQITFEIQSNKINLHYVVSS